MAVNNIVFALKDVSLHVDEIFILIMLQGGKFPLVYCSWSLLVCMADLLVCVKKLCVCVWEWGWGGYFLSFWNIEIKCGKAWSPSSGEVQNIFFVRLTSESMQFCALGNREICVTGILNQHQWSGLNSSMFLKKMKDFVFHFYVSWLQWMCISVLPKTCKKDWMLEVFCLWFSSMSSSFWWKCFHIFTCMNKVFLRWP